MDELGFIDDALISHEEERIFDLLKEKTIVIKKESQRFRRAIERALPSYFDRMAENGKFFKALLVQQFGAP